MLAQSEQQKARSLVLQVERFEVQTKKGAVRFDVAGPVVITAHEGYRVPASDAAAARLVCAHVAAAVLLPERFRLFSEEVWSLAERVRPLWPGEVRRFGLSARRGVELMQALTGRWDDNPEEEERYEAAARLIAPGARGWRLDIAQWPVRLPESVAGRLLRLGKL